MTQVLRKIDLKHDRIVWLFTKGTNCSMRHLLPFESAESSWAVAYYSPSLMEMARTLIEESANVDERVGWVESCVDVVLDYVGAAQARRGGWCGEQGNIGRYMHCS
jgi:hypothetical protein